MTPPFPIHESGWKLDRVFDTTQLRELLEQNQVICILLAHAGETFIGISNREAVIDYKVVRSSVKEKHTKGAFYVCSDKPNDGRCSACGYGVKFDRQFNNQATVFSCPACGFTGK